MREAEGAVAISAGEFVVGCVAVVWRRGAVGWVQGNDGAVVEADAFAEGCCSRPGCVGGIEECEKGEEGEDVEKRTHYCALCI